MKLLYRQFLAVLVLVVTGALVQSPATGQSLFTWTNSVNGFWNAASNWTPGAPTAAGTNKILQFNASGTMNYRATNNLGNLSLHQLVLNSSSANTITLAGNTLMFFRSNAVLPLILQNGSGAVVISNAIITTTNLTVAGTGSGNLTLSGVISGTNVAFNKMGTGTTLLRGANTFSGRVQILEGTLNINTDSRLGNATNDVNLASNAVLQVAGNFATGTSRDLNLSTVGGGTVDVTGTNVFTLAGVLRSNGVFTKTGTGTLVLNNAANLRTGTTASNIIRQGVLQVNNIAALGTTAAVFVAGGTLAHAAIPVFTQPIVLAGGTLGGTAGTVGSNRIYQSAINIISNSFISTTDARNSTTNIDLHLRGAVSGTGSVTIAGSPLPSFINLTNNLNSQSGTWFIGSNVSLIATHTNGSSLGTSKYILGDGSLLSIRLGTTNLSLGQVDVLTNFFLTNDIAVANGEATLDARRPGNQAAVVSNRVYFNRLYVTNGTVGATIGNTYSIGISGTTELSGSAGFAPVGATLALDGVVNEVTPGVKVTKSGGGTLTFTNLQENNWTGGTEVTAGTLIAHVGTNLNTLQLVTNPLGTGPLILSGGTLSIRGDFNQIVGPGAGYNVEAGFNPDGFGTLNVQRVTTAGANRTMTFNELYLGTNAFRSTTANGYTIEFAGLTTITTNSAIIDNANNLRLTGPIVGSSNAVVTKRSGGALLLTSFASNSWGGGTIIQAGSVQIAGNSGNNDTYSLGTGDITLQGGTLQLRHNSATGTRQKFGQGAGYDVVVTGNATINADRISAGNNGTAQLGALTHTNGAQLTISAGNGHSVDFADVVTVANGVRFNVTAAGVTTRFGAELSGGVEGSGLLTKAGTGRMGYLGNTNPLFAGSLSIEQGQFAWRPTNSWTTAGGNYQFGAGSIRLDGGGQFAIYLSTTASNNIGNSFQVLNSLSRGGITNQGGGVISMMRTGGNPQVNFTGQISLGGNLALAYTNTGSATPLTLSGDIMVTGGDRTLRTTKQGGDASTTSRVVISGDISADGTPRTLTLVANNRAVIELSGNNSGANNFVIQGAEFGNAGRVLFANSQALPGGMVTVGNGAYTALSFDPRSAGYTDLAALGSKFNFLPGSVLGLDGTTNGNFVLNLGAGGLNQDVRIGVSEGLTRTNSQAVTPFGNTYKFGGGGGTLVLNAANQLTGANSLNVGAERFTVPIGHASAGGTLTITASNSFTGGTLINPGATVVLNTSATNRPLGYGDVDVYGTLQVGGTRSGLAAASGDTNVYKVNLRSGSTIALDHRNTGPNTNRWADAEPMTLEGATLRLYGIRTNNVGLTEVIGDVNVALGSVIVIDGESNALTQLTVTNLGRIGKGTLHLQRDTGFVGTSNFGSSNRMTVLNTPGVTNGIVAPWIINATDHRHLTYDPAVGFTNATYSLNTLNSATLGTELVDQQGTVTLTSNPNLYALRVAGLINTNVGANTITLNSGSLVTSGNAAINASVDYAGKEALIYVGTGTLSNNAPILNATTITKFGDGTLRQNGANPSYANGWTVNRGTLQTLLPAGTLSAGSTNFAFGASAFGNFITLNGNNATLSLSSAGTNITYSSGLIRAIDQAVIVNDPQVNTTRQFFALHGMEVNAENNGPLGALLRVDLARSRTVLEAVGQVRLNADTTLNVRNTGSAGNNSGGTNRMILSGGFGGTNVVFTKTGNGVLELPGNNSSTLVNSTINVIGGTLSVGTDGSLGNAATVVNVASNAVLELNAGVIGFSPLATVNQAGGSAERWLGANGRFADSGASETIVIGTNVDLQIAYQTTNANMPVKTVQMNGGTFGGYQFIDDNRAAGITNGFNFELAADSKIGQSRVDVGRAGVTTRLNGIISELGGARSLTKVGLDTTILGAQNTYSGGTVVREGTLRLGIGNALNPLGSLVLDDQAVFDLAGFNQTVRNFRGGGLLTNSVATNTITLTTFNTVSNTYSGAMGGRLNLVKQGSGDLRLDGASTSVGAREIQQGTIVLGGDTVDNIGPLGAASSKVIINDPGAGLTSGLLAAGAYNVPQEISIIGDVGGQKIVGSTGANAATFGGNLLLVGGVTVTADAGGSATFTGTVFESGARDLTKIGGGTVALNGSGTISGNARIAQGTLLVNSTTVGNAGANHYVEAATLGGSGTVIGTVWHGFDNSFNEYAARLSPGNSAGALTVQGDVWFSSQAKLTLEIGGLIATNQHDVLNIGGGAFFDGMLELVLTDSYFPATNSIFDLVNYTSDYGGQFANAGNGARVNTTDNLGSFRVNYASTNLFVDQFQFVDSDVDGIYDAWALKHFNLLSLAAGTGPTQRYGDFDGDGQNNYAEFMAGTIPTNSMSALAISTVLVNGTANLALQWNEADEFTYRVPAYRIQYTTNFTSWQTVTNPVLSQPVAGVWQWLDDGNQTGGTAPLNLPTTRSYRVQVK